MPSPLLLSRRFAPLFWCQFFAAFNDNFLKTAVVFVILFQLDRADSEALITLASAVFIAPFFFLSALGGQLADRYDKAKVAQRLKFAEIFIGAFAVLGYARSSLPILFVALFEDHDMKQPFCFFCGELTSFSESEDAFFQPSMHIVCSHTNHQNSHESLTICPQVA